MNEKKHIQGAGSLKWFLIQRFLVIMLFIFVSEELLNVGYRLRIAPFLEETLHIRQLSVVTQDGSMLLLMLKMFFLSAVSFLPGGIAVWLRNLIGRNMDSMFRLDIISPALEGVTDQRMLDIYQLGIVFIFFGLFLITLLPYFLAGCWYYKTVTGKVKELLEEEKRQKEAYDRQRNLLLSDIAHDIKTPLTTVCGYARALVDDVVEEEEKKKEYLQAVYAKSMRMDELITLLFEYVKLDSDGFTLHREEADLGETLRENVALLYADFEENGMELEVEIPEEPFPCDLDKVQMGRALTNILSNAVKYNEKGTKVRVGLAEVPDSQAGMPFNRQYRICIEDNGDPIDEQFAEHIFEPFARGDEARSTRGGSGLGLSISSKIIQMHGGRLSLQNQCGEGFVKGFQIILTK